MTQDQITNIIKDTLHETGLCIENIECEEGKDYEENQLWFSLTTQESGLLLAHGGEGLEALNYLVRRIAERHYGADTPLPYDIFVDVSGFKKKKYEDIKTLAHTLSERAIFFKNSIATNPMSAYDRKVIHTFLQNKPNIKTESIGDGQNRHIMIIYKED